jgi:hypothetical protein
MQMCGYEAAVNVFLNPWAMSQLRIQLIAHTPPPGKTRQKRLPVLLGGSEVQFLSPQLYLLAFVFQPELSVNFNNLLKLLCYASDNRLLVPAASIHNHTNFL